MTSNLSKKLKLSPNNSQQSMYSASIYNENQLANCIRILTADAVQQANSGHPGMPLGMADVMTVLASRFLKYHPSDPKWFARDRLVLSAGHGSMLLYSFYYLCGYKDFSIEQLKSFRSIESICAGHPEYTLSDAIETTTGPLGQGIANAVGMAIAQKKYQQKFDEFDKTESFKETESNKISPKNIASYDIYCIAGDGCLMEGISYEAMSLAGHLRLDNLIILFDDNNISIDGNTNLVTSDNHLRKYEAIGFYTQAVDGHDCEAIADAITNAKNSNKPSFIACRTIIGKGSKTKSGSEKSHGSPLGLDEIVHLKESFDFDQKPFAIKDEMLTAWRQMHKHNEEEYNNWQAQYQKLSIKEQNYTKQQQLVVPDNIDHPEEEATRNSSGRVLEQMMLINEKIICGSADLAGSNNILNKHSKAITKDDFSGNFIYFGVREHAMAAICNGLAVSGFNPVCSTFFVFTDYMRPAIRLSAIMKLPVLYIMTHDSIGVGEDGPTHQPVEHLASLRAMPNINLYRPADSQETLASYKHLSTINDRPSMLVLTRQKTPAIKSTMHTNKTDYISDNIVNKGGYIVSEANDPTKIDFCIFASGSEVSIALDLQNQLHNLGKSARIISVLSMDILLQQDPDYIKSLSKIASQNASSLSASSQSASLSNRASKLLAIEAGSEFGWHRIIGSDGLFFGVNDFGHSAPAKDLFEHFGLTTEKILTAITN